ncbi:MAG: DUF2723 domain-containing protein [Bacteroidales bacterium]
MSDKKYGFYNIVIGWVVFLIAAITYIMSIEPTASFWDCGEYILAAKGMQVGHPPGSPIFVLLGRLFIIFGGSTPPAVMINIMSALASAFTILFLFWTITHLAKRLTTKEGEALSLSKVIFILAGGAVGALAYTFSDTFWFSAVEGEVYALSSLFTAIVFWAILKWESLADQAHSSRWIVLIAFIIGFAASIHLLNLLTIPAIVFVFYYKKYTPSLKGAIKTFFVSLAILLFVLYGIVINLFDYISGFELLFTNGFGMPYFTGTIIFILMLAAIFYFAIKYSIKKNLPGLNTFLVSTIFVLLGYSSYAMILIRSNADTPMNQNDPSTAFRLNSFLKREQYGDNPLFYGQYYTASPQDSKVTGDIWDKEDGRYVKVGKRFNYVYPKAQCGFFPRMYNPDTRYLELYSIWGGSEFQNNKPVPIWQENGLRPKQVPMQTIRDGRNSYERPTFSANLKFAIKYQVNFMYWRYFFWNFVGRQDDIQSHGQNLRHGQWISGIDFIDEGIRGVNNDILPGTLHNKGRNVYFFLPLILGILGILLQLKREREGMHSLWIVFLLWFMTGLAVIVYLNQTPLQPRERDYAYAGSFYAFAIWIGLGAVYLGEFLKNLTKSNYAGMLASLLCIAVPFQMLGQNWDDHNRSGRYTARDLGAQYLQSVPKNSLLFTLGDNDTFPVWYNQEVEGVRRDIKVCNIGYTMSDWYIPQMKRKTYEADPFPSMLPNKFYRNRLSESLFVAGNADENSRLDLKSLIALIQTQDRRIMTKNSQQESVFLCPARTLFLKIDKEQVLKSGIVPKQFESLIVDEITINLKPGQRIGRDEIFILDMLASTDWSRPICFSSTCGSKVNSLGLSQYMTLEGLAYRLIPARVGGSINVDKSYDIIANEFKWGNTKDTTLYIDETIQRSIYMPRSIAIKVADALTRAGRKQEAENLIDICIENINSNVVPYDQESFNLVRLYSQNGKKEKAAKYLQEMFDDFETQLNYFESIESKVNVASSFLLDRRNAESGLANLANIANSENLPDKAAIEAKFKELAKKFKVVRL